MKELRVNAIKNGTVIDHVPCDYLFELVSVLGVQATKDEILVGNYLQSKKLGTKGIIKLSNVFLDQAAVDQISLLARNATLITIKDYEVQAKRTIQLPDMLIGSVRCYNPKCITNHESAITKFSVLDKVTLQLQCHYCEKIMHEAQVTFR